MLMIATTKTINRRIKSMRRMSEAVREANSMQGTCIFGDKNKEL